MNATAEMDLVEATAFSMFCEFIRGAVGTRRLYRTKGGDLVPETLEQACLRRWQEAAETVREEFQTEAKAAIRVAQNWSE